MSGCSTHCVLVWGDYSIVSLMAGHIAIDKYCISVKYYNYYHNCITFINGT